MKLGSCLLLISEVTDPLGASHIPLVKESGYDYAEVSLARLLNLDDKALSSYRDAFLEARLPVEVFNNAIPQGLSLIGPCASAQNTERYIDRAVSLAKYMGVQLITMSGPNRRTVPADFGWEEGFPQYIAFLRMFAAKAAAHEIVLAIEPINDEEHSFISTISEAHRAVVACGCNDVKIIVDTYHFKKQGDDAILLLSLCKDGEIAHIHFAEQEGRTYPIAQHAEAYRSLFGQLTDAGYTGRISIEAFAAEPDKNLPGACALLRKLLYSNLIND